MDDAEAEEVLRRVMEYEAERAGLQKALNDVVIGGATGITITDDGDQIRCEAIWPSEYYAAPQPTLREK